MAERKCPSVNRIHKRNIHKILNHSRSIFQHPDVLSSLVYFKTHLPVTWFVLAASVTFSSISCSLESCLVSKIIRAINTRTVEIEIVRCKVTAFTDFSKDFR